MLCVRAFAYPCVCEPHACSTLRSQKRASDPLKLELQAVGSLQVGLRLEPGSSARASNALTAEPSLQLQEEFKIKLRLAKWLSTSCQL